ncbi:MAG: response regulator [Bacteroidetes bacterium]|nr:response regulator [Bacteroidota bacterium]
MNCPKAIQSNRPPKFGRDSILIIEDNPDHQFLVKRALEECIPGIKAVVTSTRQLALDLLTTNHDSSARVSPRLILLDLYLPTRAEGVLTLQALKNHFVKLDQPPVPVVMFSYSDHVEDINLCYRHGANAYLVKLPDYHDWVTYFSGLRDFWLETATLPPHQIF